MSVLLRDVVAFLDTTLEIGRFRDYGLNGLQVEGRTSVNTVVTGVSANQALFERALELKADLVVVHHGLVWGPGIAKVVGPTARRLRLLLAHDISLAAYHLPLDKHPRLGNNAGLADALGLTPTGEWFGEVKGTPLGMIAEWSAPVSRVDALARVATISGALGSPFAFEHGPEFVRRVGLCSGAAGDLLEDAAGAGCDLYVTGELAERAAELARELGINLVAAGHYATEVFGPQRVAAELRAGFPSLAVHFVPVPTEI